MNQSRGPVFCHQVITTFPVKVKSRLEPTDMACVEALSLSLDQVTSCGNCCTIRVPCLESIMESFQSNSSTIHWAALMCVGKQCPSSGVVS